MTKSPHATLGAFTSWTGLAFPLRLALRETLRKLLAPWNAMYTVLYAMYSRRKHNATRSPTELCTFHDGISILRWPLFRP